jgi:hypothetical protein
MTDSSRLAPAGGRGSFESFRSQSHACLGEMACMVRNDRVVRRGGESLLVMTCILTCELIRWAAMIAAHVVL